VTIPHAGQGVGGPTGLVFNGSSDFDVEAGKPAIFIFASRDGTISAWNPMVNPTVAIEKVKATPGSVLTGATIVDVKNQRLLFVADVHQGKIRVFDKNFHETPFPTEAFDDDLLPGNFVPFNIQNIGGNLYVSFAQQNQAKNFVNLGPGLGAVDVFAQDGQLLQRLQTGPLLNAPWGLVLAPTDFGSFSHSVLVGQFGSGQILAFDAITGRFEGQLRDQDNNIISIPACGELPLAQAILTLVEQISSSSMPVLIKPAVSTDSLLRCPATSLKGTTNKNFEGVAIGSFDLRIASRRLL